MRSRSLPQQQGPGVTRGLSLIEGVHPPFTTKFSVFAAAVLLGVVNYDH
jgi:hypothetical protein